MRRVLLFSAFVVCLAANANSQSSKPALKGQAGKPAATASPSPAAVQAARASFAKLPLSFEENVGQTDSAVKFTSRSAGYNLFLTADEAVFALRDGSGPSNCAGAAKGIHSDCGDRANQRPQVSALWIKLLGANPSAQIGASDPLPGKINYYVGNDPSKWRIGVRQFGRVNYRGIYPGVDLTYYGNEQQLESDFVVAPGANPRSIEFEVKGTHETRIDANGNLILAAAAGNVELLRPVVYQMENGAKREISGRYVLLAENRIGFKIGKYDTHETLVIDPTLVYATFLGGNGLNGDEAFAIAIDSTKNAYIAGEGTSANFPGADPNGLTVGNSAFAFVTEFDPTGSSAGASLIYSTILGGSSGVSFSAANSAGYGIGVDSSGNAYVAGITSALGFPMVNPFQSTYGAAQQTGFVAGLAATTGTLTYSTYYGGRNPTDTTELKGLFADSTGNAYVVGDTNSPYLPTVGPLQKLVGTQNVVVAKFNNQGQALYSTYLGGTGSDTGLAIAADANGNAYVTGQTDSTDFPLKGTSFQAVNNGSPDAFVAKLSFSGSAVSLVNSTYLGGSSSDEGTGIAVDSANPPNVYVTGNTSSSATGGLIPFPTQSPIIGTLQGTENAFVTKIAPNFATLVYSTYLGGTGTDQGNAIALDSATPTPNAFVTGSTTSANFPTKNPIQPVLGATGVTNAFITEVNGAGSALNFSTYLGGNSIDQGFGIAVDSADEVFIAGKATSQTFPVVSGGAAGTQPYQERLGTNNGNAFVAKISPATPSALSFFPPVYDFRTVGVGLSKSSAIITLTNNTGSAVTINSGGITIAGANAGDFSQTNNCPVSPAMLASGAFCTFQATFTPMDQDARTAQITVASSAPATSMTLNGTGGVPEIRLSQTSITFFPNPDPLNVLASTSISIVNTGGAPLIVGGAQIQPNPPSSTVPFSIPTNSTTCFSAPILPNSSCNLEVDFTPTTGTTTATTYNATLLINDNVAGSPQTLPMTGAGIAEVIVSPTSFDLGPQVVNTISTNDENDIFVENGSGGPITLTITPGTSASQGDFHINSSPTFENLCTTGLTLSPGGTCIMVVYFQPTAAGARAASYLFSWSGTQSGSQNVNITGTGLTGISLYANSITAPNEYVGVTESSTGLEAVINGSPNPINVTSIVLTGNNPGDFTAQLEQDSTMCPNPPVVPANSACVVDLSFTPSALGLRTVTGTFTYTGVSNGQLVLNATGTGIPGPVQFPTSFNFGSEIVNTTTPTKVFEFRNVSTVPMTIQSVTPPANADFAVTSSTCVAGPIPAGGTCFISVAFTPKTAAVETSSLVITDTFAVTGLADPSSPHTLNLTGTGEPAQVTISVTSGGSTTLSFGNVPITPSPVPQAAIFLTNASNSPTTINWSGGAPVLATTGTDFALLTTGNYATTCTQGKVVLPQGGTCVIGVSFDPLTSTTENNSVVFSDSVGGSHTVLINGTGVQQGNLVLSPTSITFGSQLAGTLSTGRPLMLNNNGSGPMTITNVSLTGTEASDFRIAASGTTCTDNFVVPAGMSCIVNLKFAVPSTAGFYFADVIVQANLGNGATYSNDVSLSGTSVTGLFPLSPAGPIAFGSVAVGSTVTSTFYTLTNGNSSTVTFPATNSILVPAGYTVSSNGCTGAVASDSECFFELSFTPTIAGADNGNVQLVFTGGSTTSPFDLTTVTGTGVAGVVVNPNPVAFPSVGVGNQGFEQLTLANGSASSATITGVTITPSQTNFVISSNGCSFALTPSGGTCFIDLTFQAATIGNFSATLNVAYTLGGTAQTPILVPLTASTTGPVAVIVTPAGGNPLSFPGTPVNTASQPVNVVISNTGNDTLFFNGFQMTGNDFSYGPFPNSGSGGCGTGSLASGQSCTIPITFTPQAAGSRSGTLTIVDNANPTMQMVALNGTGIGGIITVSPSAMTFPSTNDGSTLTLAAIVTNTGSTVSLGATTFTGPYSLGTGPNACGSSISSVTGTCVLYITFTPTGSGTSGNTGTAVIHYGASGTVNMTLSGTASNPAVNVSPSSLTFTAQTVGSSSSPQTVTLSNPTSSSVVVSSSAPTITGTNAGDFSIGTNACAGQTLAATTGSCTVTVVFKPGVSGGTGRSATLTISDSSPAATFPVALSGTAIAPVASLSGSTIAFGNEDTGQTAAQQFVTLTNTGNASLSISTVVLGGTNSGDFALATPSTGIDCRTVGSLAASASCNVAVTFAPTATGSRTATITITDNANPATQLISLTGTGTQPGVSFVPTSIPFAGQLIKTTSTQSTTVLTNSGTGPLTINAGGVTITGTNSADFALVTPSGVGVTNCVSASAVIVASSGTCTIAVTFTPAAAGARSASVSIADNASGSPQTVALSGTGTAPAASLNPTTTVSFGNEIDSVPSGQQTVTLTNTGTASLTLATVALSGTNQADFAIVSGSSTTCTNGATIGFTAPNNTCAVVLTFTPGAAGARSATLTFTDNASGTAGTTQTLSLTGTGQTPPTATPSPASVPFPNQLVGTTSSPTTVTITNTGTATLAIASIALDVSGNPGDFVLTAGTTNPCPLTGGNVSGVSNCTFNVAFKPTAASARTATVNITDNGNATGAPGTKQTVGLTGTGTAPAAQVAATLPFGNQPISQTSTMPLVLTNNGTAPLTLAATNAVAITTGANSTLFGIAGTTTCTNGLSIPASGTCTINVTFTPTAVSTITGVTLVITDNSGAITGSTQSVALSGSGVTASVNFAPSPLNFTPNQNVGTTSANATVTLTNSGGLGVQLAASNAAVISGTNASDFAIVSTGTTCINSATVAASGGSCKVILTFTPSATGPRTATLTVTDNANPTTQTVTLNGTGIAPAVSLNPATTVSFGNEIDGVPSGQQTVTLTNTGTASLTLATVALSGTNQADFAIVSGSSTTCTNGATIGFTAPNNTCAVVLTFTPGAAGARSATLTFNDNSNDVTGSTQLLTLSGTGQTPPTATPSPASVPFPNQLVGTTSSPTTVTITNTGTATLAIASIALDVSGNPGDFVLTAGTTNPCPLTGGNVSGVSNCTFNVAFKPTAASARTATVNITDNGNATGAPGTKQTVGLTGTGTAPAAQVAATLPFGNQPISQTSTMPLVLTNNGTAPLTLAATNAVAITTGANSTLFGIAGTTTCTNGLSIPASGTCTINVTFTPTAVSTITGVTLVITDNSGAVTGSTQSVALSGSGVTSTVNFNPSTVGFGNQPVGVTSAQMTSVLTNSGTSSLLITSVTLTGADPGDFALVAPASGTQCQAGSVASQGTCTVAITFKPTATGARSATVSVVDNATGSPHTLTLTGTGTAPVVSLSTSTVAFSPQIQTTTSGPQTVTLTNTGTAVLNIGTVVLGGTNPGDFAIVSGAGTTCPGLAVGFTAPNNTCTVALTFTPATATPYSATLTFTDNASPTTQVVNLTGTGVTPPTATPAPTSLTFTSQPTATTSVAQPITLTNSGGAPLTVTSITLTGANPGDYAFASPATTCPTSSSGQVAAGTNCVLSVTFSPTATGTRTASISIVVTGIANPVPITLTGTGTAPDVAIAKTHVGNFEVGSNGTYTIKLTNNGTVATQHAITVTDTLPAGLSLVSGAPVSWTCSAGTQNAQIVTCTNPGPINTGAGNASTLTLTVSVGAAAFPAVTNTATVADAGDSGTTDKSSTDQPTTITAPDVTISETTTGDFVAGANGVYTIKATNGGTGPTTGTITVTNTLPAGLAFVSNAGIGWACTAGAQNAQVVTCLYTGAALTASGGNSTFTMTASVAPGAITGSTAAGFMVTANATVSDPNDSKTTDKSATNSTNVDNAKPAQSAFAPSSGLIVGTGVTPQQITLTGSGFNSTTLVTIGSNPALTGTANAAGTSLVITVPAGDLATAGNVTISVNNPANPTSSLGGGNAATTQTFPLVSVTATQDASTAGTITVTAGTPATVKIDYSTNPANSPLPAMLTITCTPQMSLTGGKCSVAGGTIAAGATSGSATITITAIPTSGGMGSSTSPKIGGRGTWPTYLMWLVVAVLISMLGMLGAVRQRVLPLRRAPAYLTLVLLALAAGALVGCTASGPTPTPTGPSTVTVTATTADGATVTTTVNINVVN